MLRNPTQYVCLNSLALALLCGPVDGHATEQQLVLLYNQAHVPAETLSEGADWASRIMRASGIELNWRDCLASPEEGVRCDQSFGPASLTVQVLPSSASCPHKRGLAWSSVSAHGANQRTLICMARVRDFMASNAPPFGTGQMLGHVIAHEMGHLLLALVGHTQSGIMVSPWLSVQMGLIARGELRFDYGQGKRMCDEVKRRTSAQRIARQVP